MANLTSFGIQFATKVLEKTYQNAVFEGVVNRNYEGEIKKPGDRVRILSFLNSLSLTDYSVGTDMINEAVVDSLDILLVEKRKYYMFTLDRLEDLFTFAGDVPEHLLNDAAKVLERTIDTYVLDKFGSSIKAGSWVGVNMLVLGSGQTEASIATTSTGGTITVNANSNTYESQIGSAENPLDGTVYFAGFQAIDLYKGVRLVSTRAFVSPWYRIATVTNSTTATLTEWDEATSGSDFEEGFTLRGLFGGDGRVFPKYGSSGDAPLINFSSLGWEIQAAIATTITSSIVYEQTTMLNEALNENEVPDTDRKIVVPPPVKTALLQASELQPTGISEIYSGVILNGRAMRLGGFDVMVAAGSRVSTRAGKSTSTNGPSADITLTAGTTGWLIPAVHTECMTYADKWSESRVVDAENQFSKKYQGLYLFGALVPAYRRKYGAMLFGS